MLLPEVSKDAKLTSLVFPDCRSLWSDERAGVKFNKGVGAKSSLIKWSQDWSLDLTNQVVKEVEEEGRDGFAIWS